MFQPRSLALTRTATSTLELEPPLPCPTCTSTRTGASTLLGGGGGGSGAGAGVASFGSTATAADMTSEAWDQSQSGHQQTYSRSYYDSTIDLGGHDKTWVRVDGPEDEPEANNLSDHEVGASQSRSATATAIAIPVAAPSTWLPNRIPHRDIPSDDESDRSDSGHDSDDVDEHEYGVDWLPVLDDRSLGRSRRQQHTTWSERVTLDSLVTDSQQLDDLRGRDELERGHQARRGGVGAAGGVMVLRSLAAGRDRSGGGEGNARAQVEYTSVSSAFRDVGRHGSSYRNGL